MQIEIINRTGFSKIVTKTEPIVSVFRPPVSGGKGLIFELAVCPELTGSAVASFNGEPCADEYQDVTTPGDFQTRFDDAMCRWAFNKSEANQAA